MADTDSWTLFCSEDVRKYAQFRKESSFLIGWRFDEIKILVLSTSIPVKCAEDTTKASRILHDLLDVKIPEIIHLGKCNKRPSIIGYNIVGDCKQLDETLLEFSVAHDGTISIGNTETFTVYFQAPDPFYLQSLELSPLMLDTTVIDPDDSKRPRIPYSYPERIRSCLQQHFNTPHPKVDFEFHEIIECINCCAEMNNLMRKKLGLRNWSFKKQLRQAVLTLLFMAYSSLLKMLRWPFLGFVMLIRLVAEFLLVIMSYAPTSRYSLINISCFSQQVALRLEQFCYWPEQISLFQTKEWRYSKFNKAQYISFFNNVWLIANDIIVGMAIGEILIINQNEISQYLETSYNDYAVVFIQNVIVWLMGYPAGLKLNSNLTKFIGELFLWLISIWSSITDNIWPFMPTVISIVGYAGIFGASMSLSIVHDVLSVMSLNFLMFYQTALRIYYGQLNALISLFHLFRGKKYNVLRQRMDSSEYEMDQVLLGTILFAILFFLFPTVSVYYILFALV